ncbi:MAG TPA: hypothetical protein VE397_15265 [Stellaceae bacterium]|nr:hypothetical protein [Stellaceae bacterium]
MAKLSRRLALAGLAAAATGAGTATGRADPPGSLFLDFENNTASMVQTAQDIGQPRPRITKAPAKLSETVAANIVAGAQPIGKCHIIVAYQGQLYIVPDKQLADSNKASDMVVKAAMHTMSD